MVNPFEPPKSNQDFALEFALILSERKSLYRGGSDDILTRSVFVELILVWTLTSSVLSEAHAFNAFTMADKPVEKASTLTEKSMCSQVILKILMGVEIAEFNSHTCKLDFLCVV